MIRFIHPFHPKLGAQDGLLGDGTEMTGGEQKLMMAQPAAQNTDHRTGITTT